MILFQDIEKRAAADVNQLQILKSAMKINKENFVTSRIPAFKVSSMGFTCVTAGLRAACPPLLRRGAGGEVLNL